jgi:hypothetical protein
MHKHARTHVRARARECTHLDGHDNGLAAAGGDAAADVVIAVKHARRHGDDLALELVQGGEHARAQRVGLAEQRVAARVVGVVVSVVGVVVVVVVVVAAVVVVVVVVLLLLFWVLL